MKRECVSSHKTFSINDCDSVYSHQMKAKFGKEVCHAIEESIKKSLNPTVVWSSFPSDANQSMGGPLQVLSDKSQMTFSSDSVKFYSLHLTLLNFTNEIRIHQTNSGNSIITYILWDFFNENADNHEGNTGTVKRAERIDFIIALHDSTHESFEPMDLVAVKGSACYTEDSHNMLIHTIPES